MLFQYCPLQVTLLPEFCCHRQGNLTDIRQQTHTVLIIEAVYNSSQLIYSTCVRLTLLWTSQGLVIADKSHAVIIIALKWKTYRESEKCHWKKNCILAHCTHMTISFLVVSRDMKSTHFFSSSYVCERSTIFWNIVLFLAKYWIGIILLV